MPFCYSARCRAAIGSTPAVAAVIIAACSGTSRPVATPEPGSRSAAEDAPATTATVQPGPKPCVLEASRAIALEVRPAGAPPLWVTVWDSKIRATLGSDPQLLSCSVEGAFRFDGWSSPEHLGLRLAYPYSSPDGVAALAAFLPITGAAADRDGASATVQVGRSDETVATEKLELVGVSLPCDAIAVGEGTPEDGALRFDADAPVVNRAGQVGLFAAAGDPEPAVKLVPLDDFVPLFVKEGGDGWWRVGVAWADGSSIRGWVREQEVRPPKVSERHKLADATKHSTPSSIYGVLMGESVQPPPVGTQPRKARLAAGAPVHAAPGGIEWARVARSDGYLVGWNSDAEWIAIVEAPGLSNLMSWSDSGVVWQAWVPRSAVTLLE